METWRGEGSYQGPLTFVIPLFLSNIFLLAFCGSLQTGEVSPDSIVPQLFSVPCCQEVMSCKK